MRAPFAAPRLQVSHKTRPVICRGDRASTGTPAAPALAAEAAVPRSFAPLSLRTMTGSLDRVASGRLLPHASESGAGSRIHGNATPCCGPCSSALGPPDRADRGDRAQVLDQHTVDGEPALA